MAIHGAEAGQRTASPPDPLAHYGSARPALRQLIADVPALGEKLDANLEFLRAEIVWAARHELARTVEDVLARRVRVLFLEYIGR